MKTKLVPGKNLCGECRAEYGNPAVGGSRDLLPCGHSWRKLTNAMVEVQLFCVVRHDTLLDKRQIAVEDVTEGEAFSKAARLVQQTDARRFTYEVVPAQ